MAVYKLLLLPEAGDRKKWGAIVEPLWGFLWSNENVLEVEVVAAQYHKCVLNAT